MKRLPFVLFVSGLTVILSLGTFWTTVAQAGSTEKFTLDVACDFDTAGINLPDPPPVDPSIFPPDRATVIIVNGNIYPKRSLPKGKTEFDPNADGEIGTWRCHFAGLGRTDLPLVGAVTYYFQMKQTGYDSKESMIVVQGLNSHIFPNSQRRRLAVVGGTGRYAGATGEVIEKVLGTNASGCFNLRFRFRLRGVRDDDDWDDD